jgi:phosphoglycerol geranylgeranyltransferase
MAIKIGKVEKHIYDMLEDKGALLFTLIDPVDYKTPDDAVKKAKVSVENGVDAVLIGGSTSAQGELLDYVAKGIKDSVSAPIILFPGNIATVTKYADAFYFQSMLNARNPYWITHVQMLGAPVIRSLGIEPLPVGYIVVSPGGTVGWVADANLIPREKPQIAASLALAGQYLGNRFILTDSGSNPQIHGHGPIPSEMVRAVRQAIDVTYIVAGGIKEEKDLRSIIKNGADIVQIGTAIEKSDNVKAKARFLSDVVKEEGSKKKHR